MSKDSEIKKVDDEMKAKVAAEAKVSSIPMEVKPAAETSKPAAPKPAAETSKPAADASKSAAEKPAADASKAAASEPEKSETKPEKSEMILISKEEYEIIRNLIRFNNDLAGKLGRMGDTVDKLTEQVASLGGKIGELTRQLDSKVEKPVLVYRATFADGEEVVSDKETDIYAKSMLPKRLVQVYAWKRGKEFKLLDDDELESLGLKNP